jgi:iron(III) transport system permease protein
VSDGVCDGGDVAVCVVVCGGVAVCVVVALAVERLARRRGRTAAGARSRSVVTDMRRQLTGVRAWLATAICGIPIAVGFAIPVLLLLRLMALEPDVAFSPRFFAWLGNSVRVATIAALLAVALALLVAYSARLAPGPATRATSRLLTLGYAIPGTVLAIGVLMPIGTLDAWIADAVRRWTGANPGLLLTGTVVALVYAYVVRYFAVAWNGIEPGFARITPAMDSAARALGAGRFGTLWRVHRPLLARSVAAAFLLTFVDVMKELPATLLMRPFNFDTLATQTYLFAKDERLAEAALPSLAIVAAGLGPILLLARAARRASPTGVRMATATAA